MNVFGLKVIALITMFVDHFAVIFMNKLQIPINLFDDVYQEELYWSLRSIGAISLPLFAFCIGIGLKQTRNIKIYIYRLFIFPMISMIPYYILISVSSRGLEEIFYIDRLNIMMSFFGSTIIIFIYKRFLINCNLFNKIMLFLLITLLICICAEKFNEGYNSFGILLPCLVYFSKNKFIPFIIILIPVILVYQNFNLIFIIFSAIPAIICLFYNGERGISLIYIFYIFYPVYIIFIIILHHLIVG